MVTAHRAAAKKAAEKTAVPDLSIQKKGRWLTRTEASDMLTVSSQTLANYERRGFLHPQYDNRPDKRGAARSVIVYDPEELAKLDKRLNRHGLSPRDPGVLSACACALFDEGLPAREIVRRLQVTFETVRDLHEKWLDGGGADIVLTPTAKETLEKAVGPFKGIGELVDLITKRLAPA